MCQQAMKGKNAFAEFVQFLAKNLNSACGFIFQAQLMTADQRASYSYRDSQAAKDVTIWLNGHADRVQGNSAHKQRLMTNAAKDPSSVDRGDDFGLDDKRAFITMFADHRCPERSVPSGPPVIDGDQESDSVSLTSASALAMREHMKRMTGRGPTPKSLAYTLQLQEPSRVMQETSLPRLNDKLALFGPSNPAVAKQVRRFLVGGGPVDETTLNNLLQGAIAQARDDGDYAELIEASAQEVRDRMHEIAEARYRNQWKRACAGRPGKMPPFDPSRANIPQVDDRDEYGNPISYLIGWCLAPGYVRKGIDKDTFCKYSAIDCAFAKRRGQGTFYLEAILGGDRSIHIAFVMQLLATECDFGVNLHHKHMRTAYQDKFNSKDFVCGTDGGISLIKGIEGHRPQVFRIRDYRHFILDLKSKRARTIAARIHDLPPSRKDDITEILRVLEQDDKDTYAALTHVPLSQWCRAFMPTEAYHHGNKVTSCVEVAAMMIKPARMQTTLAAAFVQVKAFIRMRWLHIYQLSIQPSCHGCAHP